MCVWVKMRVLTTETTQNNMARRLLMKIAMPNIASDGFVLANQMGTQDSEIIHIEPANQITYRDNNFYNDFCQQLKTLYK